MKTLKQIIKDNFSLLIILVIAAVLRVNLLFARGTFWFDEQFSIHFSSIPSWNETIKYWILETNPPLFTFLLRFYLPLINQTKEATVRLLPLFFGLLGIVLLYIFAKKVFSKKVAILSALFLSLSSLHIIISTETRVYSLLLLLAIASCFFFYEITFEKKQSKIIWILYTLTNVLLIYSHLTAVLIPLIQFLTLTLLQLKKDEKNKWCISQIISTALWLPWFIPSIISKLNINSASAWYFNTGIEKSTSNIVHLLILPFVSSLQKNLLVTLFLILLFVAFFVFIRLIKKSEGKQKNILLFILLWALLPILLSSLLGVFVSKYVIISYPAIYLLAAIVLNKYAMDKKKFAAIIIGIIIILLPQSIETSASTIFSWNKFNKYIQENETDKSIILLPFAEVISFEEYYKGNSPIIGLYTKEDDFSTDERIVRYNWNKLTTTEDELANWVFSNTEKNNNADKIFLIQHSEKNAMIHDILFKYGWKLNNKQRAPGHFDYYLFEFNAQNNTTTSPISEQTNK